MDLGKNEKYMLGRVWEVYELTTGIKAGKGMDGVPNSGVSHMATPIVVRGELDLTKQ